MDPNKVVIEAERLGLPATASAVEIRDKVHNLVAELSAMTQERNKWKDRAEENQSALVEARKAIHEKKSLEGQLIIQQARDEGKINKADEAFYLELYATNPELCKKRLEGLADRRYLRTQESLKGEIGDPPSDPTVELSVKVAEVMANDKNLTEAGAVQKVYRDDPALFQRVTEHRRKLSADKGGER